MKYFIKGIKESYTLDELISQPIQKEQLRKSAEVNGRTRLVPLTNEEYAVVNAAKVTAAGASQTAFKQDATDDAEEYAEEKASKFYAKVKGRLVTGAEARKVDAAGTSYPALSAAVKSVCDNVQYAGAVDGAVAAVLVQLNIS